MEARSRICVFLLALSFLGYSLSAPSTGSQPSETHFGTASEETPKGKNTTQLEACVDKHGNCGDWAEDEECQKNPTWMMANCPLSCQVCDATKEEEEEKDAMEYIANQNKNEKNVSANLWQGDIVMDQNLRNLLDYHRGRPMGRNAIFSRYNLWITRIVPYEIPSYMSHVRSNFLKATAEIEKHTCIRFTPYRSWHKNKVRITSEKGCFSRIGRNYYRGYQTISLPGLCNNVGTIIHELLHCLGFFHEQSRPDRDKHVKVHWNNIQSSAHKEFEIYPEGVMDLQGKGYDYDSIMHYGRTSFTKDGSPTIEAIGNPSRELGGQKLSRGDIDEINRLYDCQTTQYGWTRWSGFSPCDQNTCYKMRMRYCYNKGDVKICGKDTDEYGHEVQKVKCPSTVCPKPVDGVWSLWSPWKPCSVTCGEGIRHRSRRCDNPVPKNGGKTCPGNSKETGTCALQRCQLDFNDADFEKTRMGMWSNDPAGQVNWEFQQYGTRTAGTGVKDADHTFRHYDNIHGTYLVMISYKGNQGNKARLRSQWLQPQTELQCLNFHYFMRGKGMGTLNLKVQVEGETKETLWFQRKGEQEHEWVKGEFTVGFDKRYRFIFEAVLGRRFHSDMALDDIYLDPGPCNCQDTRFTACPRWAKTGECSKNTVWMWKNCARSCGTCACKDKNSNCAGWSDDGECKNNPTWMLVNCPLSCGVCDCFDHYGTCPDWKKLCTNSEKWKDFMEEHCRRTCQLCTS